MERPIRSEKAVLEERKLTEQYAGLAMQGMLANSCYSVEDMDFGEVAHHAWLMAREMIKVRDVPF